MARLDAYLDLIASFVEAERIAAEDFALRYLELFKADQTLFPDAEFDILDGLFGDADMFEADPDLRDPGDVTEVELRAAAAAALVRLRAQAAAPGADEPSTT